MRYAWTAGRTIITIAIFAYVLRDFDPAAAAAALGRLSSSVLGVALLMVALDRLLMYWRWAILIRAAVPVDPPTNLLRIFFVSSFLGSFLPAGVGGDAARAYQVGRQTRELSPAIASVIVDRWLGLMAVGLAGCAGVLLTITALPAEVRQLTIAVTLLLAVTGVAAMYADWFAARLLPASLVHTRPGRVIRRLAAALALFRRTPRALWAVTGMSFAVQGIRIGLAWVIGHGLGISLPFSYYWVFMPLNILVILLPLSLGGLGLPQGTMVWTLEPLGVPATEAFLLSLLFVLAGVIGNLPGAVLYASGSSGHEPGSTEGPR